MFCTSGIVGSKNVPACVRGYAVRRPLVFYTFYFTLWAVLYDFGFKFCVSVRIVCTRGIVGSKNVPACVRGYAVRRPGIFYTFYFNFRARSFHFGSTMVSSFVNLVIRLV